MRSRLLVFLALTALGTASAPAADAPVDPRTRRSTRSSASTTAPTRPAARSAIYRDGKIVYARGYGMANLELGVANTSQTVFDIGSTAKQFSAFAIQLLAREGKLSLDDDVRKWVPEIPSYGKTVTIRHLLHHTGGLRDYIELMSLQGVMERGPDDRSGHSRHHGAPEGAQLRAGRGAPLLQHGLLPALDHREAGDRTVAARLRGGADLRSPRDAPYAVQRLAHADHPEPRDRLRAGRRAASSESTCPTGSRTATAGS